MKSSLLTVPAAPRLLTASQVTPTNVTLHWAPPLSIPGQLKAYHITAQLLSDDCEMSSLSTAQDELHSDCVDSDFTVIVTALDSGKENHSVTLQSLAKYRYYRFRVAAVTNAGVGDHSDWIYARTLAGSKNPTEWCGFSVVSQEVRHNIWQVSQWPVLGNASSVRFIWAESFYWHFNVFYPWNLFHYCRSRLES